MKILVLDDDPHFGRTMQRWFERRGHGVRVVRSVQAAMAGVLTDPPDVAVIDLGLNDGEGGLDFLDWIATTHPLIRRVLCTANAPPDDFVEVPPIQRFSPKPPISLDEFAHIVEKGTYQEGKGREPK